MDNRHLILLSKNSKNLIGLMCSDFKEAGVSCSGILRGRDRFAYRHIPVSEGNIQILEEEENWTIDKGLIGKDVTLLATDHSAYSFAFAISAILKKHGVGHRKFLVLLDLPLEQFCINDFGPMSSDQYLKEDFDIVMRHLKQEGWDIISNKAPTKENLLRYYGVKSAGPVYYPIFYMEPQSLEPKEEYVTYCARITRQKGNLDLVKMFSKIKRKVSLYFVGEGDQARACVGYAKNLGVDLKIFSNIPEQEKYDLINGALFTVCGEKNRYCGSASPLEGLAVGKIPCVWDNPLTREILGDMALYAETEEDFIANINLLLDKGDFFLSPYKVTSTTKEERSEFVLSRYSVRSYCESLERILWPTEK